MLKAVVLYNHYCLTLQVAKYNYPSLLAPFLDFSALDGE